MRRPVGAYLITSDVSPLARWGKVGMGARRLPGKRESIRRWSRQYRVDFNLR